MRFSREEKRSKPSVNPKGWVWRHVVVALALGTATTIAAVWSSAIILNPSFTTIEDFSVPSDWNAAESVRVIEARTPTGVRREYHASADPNWMGTLAMRTEKRAPHANIIAAPPGESPSTWGRAPWRRRSTWFEQRRWGVDDARGWPFLALWCEIDSHATATNSEALTSAGAIRIPWPPRPTLADLRVLPYRPIWSGFFLNTVLFGGGWFVLGLLLPWMRSRRARFGQCPRCRHDVLGSGGPERGCTECGWNRGHLKNTHGR